MSVNTDTRASGYDAIVVGAGHNGLVTALYLARAGWKVLVLERNARVGGAIMSGEITRPGFIHDLYSTNQNLFLASPVYKELKSDLERHGLRHCISDKPFTNVFPDGTSLHVYRDPEKTLEGLRRHSHMDADGWTSLYRQFKKFQKNLLPLYAMPLPSAQAAMTLLKALNTVGASDLAMLAQIVLSSTRELGDVYFVSREAKALVATWGMHLDFGPNVSGGAMFPFLESFGDMEAGMAIAEGGASHMVDALAGLVEENGGEIRTSAEVLRLLTEGETVTGVELAGGEQIQARQAVIANLTPTLLFGKLLADHPFSDAFRRKVRGYKYGPGTMMVHLALSGKPRWNAGEEVGDFAYVHIPPYVEDLNSAYNQAMDGLLPENPLLIVGQTSVVDPSRAPEGRHVLWVQVRALPPLIRGDASGEIEARTWDEAREPYADRVMDKLEQYAPGIKALVLDRVVYSPADLERHDPNLRGGDSISGSHHLRQNFLWRPFPGWSTYRMPMQRLYMVGAATWPGAGTNATSGYLAAQEILHPHDLRNRVVGGGVAVGAVAGAALVGARLLGGHGRGNGS